MNAEHEHVTVNLPPPPPPPPLLHPFYCRHMASNPSSEKLWIPSQVNESHCLHNATSGIVIVLRIHFHFQHEAG